MISIEDESTINVQFVTEPIVTKNVAQPLRIVGQEVALRRSSRVKKPSILVYLQESNFDIGV